MCLRGRRAFDYVGIDYQRVILMRRADPTQKQAVGTGVLYNHLTINDLQGVAAPTPPAVVAGVRRLGLVRSGTA